jgi:NADH dehydrogenase
MIFVVGATGLLGSEICRRLAERGRPVRALVRAGSSRAALVHELCAEVVEGDLRDRASLERACRGATAVITTATAMGARERGLTLNAVDRAGQLRLLDVARASGVASYVYVSLSPNLRSSAPLVRYKRQVERAVRTSRLRWTILQPTAFMEVWLGPTLGWDPVAGRATVVGSGNVRVPWISIGDVAEHAVRALDDPRLTDCDVPLGGPEALSANEVLRLFEWESGRPYSARRVPRAALAVLAPAFELFDERIASALAMGAQLAAGDPIDSPMQRELALPLTTVRDYVVRTLGR